MLPSAGYFSNVRCQFFDAGSCDRPHCHYKHTKKGSLQNEEFECVTNVTRHLQSNDVQIDDVDNVIQEVVNEIQQVPKHEITSNTATYNPTPIDQLNQQQKEEFSIKSSNNESSNFKHPAQKQSQYKPHIPILYSPSQPPVRNKVNYVPSSNLLTAYRFNTTYTPQSNGKQNSSTYVPSSSSSTTTLSQSTDTNTNESDNSKSTVKNQYIPKSINKDETSNIDYQPTQITSINTQTENLKYSPPGTSSEFTYEPTKTDDKQLTELVDNLDFINDILNEVSNDPNYKKDETDKKLSNKHKSSSSSSSKSNKHKSSSKSSSSSSKHKHSSSSSKTSSSSSKTSSKTSSSSTKSSSSTSKTSSKTKSSKDESKSSRNSSSGSHNHNSSSSSTKSDRHDKHRSKSSSSSKSSKSSSSSHHNSSTSKLSTPNSSTSSSKSSNGVKRKIDNENDNQPSKRLVVDSSSVFKESMIVYSDDDLDDIEEQCRRIFEDSTNVKPPSTTLPLNKNIKNESVDNEIPVSKKRIAHASASTSAVITVAKKFHHSKPNFTQQSSLLLLERYRISAEKQREKFPNLPNHGVNLTSTTTSSSSSSHNLDIPRVLSETVRAALALNTSTSSTVISSTTPLRNTALKIINAPLSVPSGKRRIAHVPNVSGLLSAKSTVNHHQRTMAQSQQKGQSRVMHQTNVQQELLDRPTVRDPNNSKIPLHIRSVFLNNMIDACLEMTVFADSAYEHAINEEYAVFEKCKSLAIYKNSARLCVHRLQVKSKSGTLLDCDGVASTSTSNSTGLVNTNASSCQMYKALQKYILTDVQLWENGFPKPHPTIRQNGAAIVKQRHNATSYNDDQLLKTCVRCHIMFKVNKDGFPEVKQECQYHYKNRFTHRKETRYGCCGSLDDLGCSVAQCHVFENNSVDNLRGYVETLDPSGDSPEDDDVRDHGIYALDCEMSYTTAGIELTRITVIDRNLQVVYETFVKPIHPIIDYNTRFSGIEQSHLENVTTTLLDVQANLLHMFNNRTILIGHSLENDFKALKLIHKTVIDTSVMFPHRMGPPLKRALKNLAHEYLNKIIQNESK